MLAGLKNRMMAPEVAAAAMRAYAEETNRLNRARRANADAWRAELIRIEKEIRGIIEAIKAGMFHASMKAEMDTLEARKQALADAPQDTPDLLPSISSIYAKKVAQLAEALNHADDRKEAAQALRGLIEKIVLTPGTKRGELEAALYGELSTILNWTERQSAGAANKNTPGAELSGVSSSVVAGVGFEPTTFRL